MNKNLKNKGVLYGERTTDYRADKVGGALPYKEILLSGNWDQFLPPGEWQKSDNGDSMSCVSFGSINNIETQELQQTEKQTNYSDRFLAKMSGTTPEGNYLWKVADTIRQYGLVAESSYPAPEKYTWSEYHAEIPELLLSELKAEGQEWLKKWSISYEWVATDKESLIRHLKHAPIIVVIPNHLVLNFYTTQDIINYFDSYEPLRKTTPSVVSAMKIVLTPKEQAIDSDTLLVDIKFGEYGKQVERLSRALVRVGWREAEGAVVYDQKLADVVLKFQKANLSHFSWTYYWHAFYYKGKWVDLATREIINNLLKYRK